MRPSSAEELTTATDAGAFPGFGVDISVAGDDFDDRVRPTQQHRHPFHRPW